MKLMALSVNCPMIDLRVPVNPRARFNFLSPDSAEPKRTFLNSFGLAGRRRLRMPWRPAETIFFSCRRAITLPQELPDNAPVTRVLRRLYLDSGPGR